MAPSDGALLAAVSNRSHQCSDCVLIDATYPSSDYFSAVFRNDVSRVIFVCSAVFTLTIGNYLLNTLRLFVQQSQYAVIIDRLIGVTASAAMITGSINAMVCSSR